jgi:hypothetical protein
MYTEMAWLTDDWAATAVAMRAVSATLIVANAAHRRDPNQRSTGDL